LAAGAVLRAMAPGLGFLPATVQAAAGIAGAALWGLGALWYLPALRGLWSPDVVTQGGGADGEADPPLAWFVRVAYGWFAVVGMLALASAVVTAAELFSAGGGLAPWLLDMERHALLFGYLGMLTAGLSGRLPGAFLDLGDAAVAATRLPYRAAWILLTIATALRVLAPALGPARSHGVATSGIVGAVGLWALLGVLWRLALAARARDARLRRAG
jgi:hypothetical protein